MRLLPIFALLIGLLAPLFGPAPRLESQEITPIAQIQSQFSQGDNSALVDETVTIQGIVTGVYGDLFFVEEPEGGPWSGIAVYQQGHSVVTQDQVQVTGKVVEFHDLTEIEPTDIQILSSNNPLPEPVLLKVQEAKNERWEGVLVQVQDVTVNSEPDSHGEWRIEDASGIMRVDDKGVFYPAKVGERILSLTAIVDHAFGNYRLIPRSLDDIVGSALSQPSSLEPDQFTPIYAIQGKGLSTPLAGETVDTFGLVTGVTDNGFFLQDPEGDGDPATSDGVFVYTQRRPDVDSGECVAVLGAFVSEYYDKTELSEMESVRSSNHCPTAQIEPVTIPMAQLFSDPAALFERYEGMLVQVPQLRGVVQGPTKIFRSGDVEISLVDSRLLPYIEGARVFRDQPEHTSALMYLSNELGASLPQAAWGDGIVVNPIGEPGGQELARIPANPALAVLDYNYGKYQLALLPGQTVQVRPGARVQDQALAWGEDEFSVCTFNVLGLGRGGEQYRDEAEYWPQVRKRARAIAEGLQGCTIIGLEETGKPEDAENLAQVLRDEFGLDYQAVAIPGPNSRSLEFPLTNSLLARRDRVTVLGAESRQGCSRYSYGVRYTPGECPRRQFALFNRPPLVVDLQVEGAWGEPYTLTVIVNHWKSKGGDESVNVVRRTLQAAHVASLVQERLDQDPGARVVVLGDLNDFYGSGPVETLRQGTTPPLVHVYDILPRLDRYTYIFNGASQVLDHILVTPGMRGDLAGVSPLHINADFPETETVDPGTVFRSSDHDPVQMVVRPQGAGWIGGELGLPGIRVLLEDARGQLVAETVTDGLGQFRLWDVRPDEYMLRYEPPAGVRLFQPETPVLVLAGAGLYFTPPVSHQVAELGGAWALITPAVGVVAPGAR